MTRSRVKPEPSTDHDVRNNSPLFRDLPSRAQTVFSSDPSPAPDTDMQQRSSGSTVRASFEHDTNGMQPQPQHHPGNGRVQSDGTHQTPEHVATPANGSAGTMSPSPSGGPDAMQQLGAESRMLIKATNKLDALNIESTLSLPKFAVVGDQSAGKSSIIEALCGILLPRSEGTCTRCPFQLTTSAKEGSWRCVVNLRLDFARDPTARAGPDIKYDGWRQLQTPETEPFCTVSNKQELDFVLKAAQQAILNPHQDPRTFLSGSTSQLHNASHSAVKFSPNIIALDIEGPELPELSLYDLPGSINVVDGEDDQHLVEIVKNLIKSHLSDEKTLFLLACTANQDFENSTTFRYVKECKAQDRCSGVLTKPDLMTASRFDFVKRLLKRQAFRLGGPWFVTRQLSQVEVDSGKSHSEARAIEQAFFNDTGRWNEEPELRRYLGTANLQKAVSGKLVEHILKELPKINQRVEARYNEVVQALALFPGRPLHPTYTVSQEIHRLVSFITDKVDGAQMGNDFLRDCRASAKDFVAHLNAMAPEVDCATPGYLKPTLEISDDDDDEPDSTPTPTRYVATSVKATPTKQMQPPSVSSSVKRKIEDPETPVRASGTQSSGAKRAKTAQHAACRVVFQRTVFKLDTVRDKFEAGGNSGLADQRNTKVTEHLMLMTLARWREPLNHLFDSLNKAIRKLMNDAMRTVLAKRLDTELYRQVDRIFDAVVSSMLEEQTNRVKHSLACEQHRPGTLQPLKSGNDARKAILEGKRLAARVNEHCDTTEASLPPNKATSAIDRKKFANDPNWLTKHGLTAANDQWSGDLAELARVQNYYEIASARFADTVDGMLRFGLIEGIKASVEKALTEGLGVHDVEYCAGLLVADPQRERERIKLLAEKEKLETARDELKGVVQLARG